MKPANARKLIKLLLILAVFFASVYPPAELTRVILLNLGKRVVFYTPVTAGIIEIIAVWACFLVVISAFITRDWWLGR